MQEKSSNIDMWCEVVLRDHMLGCMSPCFELWYIFEHCAFRVVCSSRPVKKQ